MSEIFTPEYLQETLEVPDTILPFVLSIPRLLPGEKDDDYLRLFDIMAGDVIPDTDLEWLWTIELAWLWFEIDRYRRWKNAIILTNRTAAQRTALANTHSGGMLLGVIPMVEAEARLEQQTLMANPKDPALNGRLLANGYDTDAINALAFVEGGGSLATVERFLTSARQQVTAILREVKSHREFARRANRATSLYLVEKETADAALAAAGKKADDESGSTG
jgi:hypothetical protein